MLVIYYLFYKESISNIQASNYNLFFLTLLLMFILSLSACKMHTLICEKKRMMIILYPNPVI